MPLFRDCPQCHERQKQTSAGLQRRRPPIAAIRCRASGMLWSAPTAPECVRGCWRPRGASRLHTRCGARQYSTAPCAGSRSALGSRSGLRVCTVYASASGRRMTCPEFPIKGVVSTVLRKQRGADKPRSTKGQRACSVEDTDAPRSVREKERRRGRAAAEHPHLCRLHTLYADASDRPRCDRTLAVCVV